MLKESTIKFGKLYPSFEHGHANNITFCVTEECNLRCKYCYLVSKNNKKKMTFDIAKKAVDYFLSARGIYDEPSIVWDFIGGEPFLEIDLIDKISDYICLKMYEMKSPWFDNYMFNFSTNGLNYDDEKVQNYIKKNIKHMSVGFSVDGNKIKHDTQRIYPDGRGSYDDVVKNVPLWLSQIKNTSTKATFSHDDLPYLKDSIISLWDLGIKNISANVVFENVWSEDDPLIFEEQLKSLADYIIENDIFEKEGYSVRFFDPNTGLPMSDVRNKHRYCGSGKAAAVDCDGNILPCIRFTDFSLNNKKKLAIGNVFDGVSLDKLKPFKALSINRINDDECKDCKVASGCTTCIGLCYDDSPSGSILKKRVKYNCEMHKANVRAIDYFWDKIESKLNGRANPRKVLKEQYYAGLQYFLVIYTDEKAVPHCSYSNVKKDNKYSCMDKSTIDKALSFAEKNLMQPIFIGSAPQEYANYAQVISHKFSQSKSSEILVVKNDEKVDKFSNVFILHIENAFLGKLFEIVKNLFEVNHARRVNIILDELEYMKKYDLNEYENLLKKIGDYILNSNKVLKVNVLNGAEGIHEEETNFVDGCGCGVKTFAVMPNGKLYVCPAFYFEDPNLSVGDLDNGITFNYKDEFDVKNFLDCNICKNYNCKRCVYLNKKMTNEYTIPPEIQCTVSKIETEIGEELKKQLAIKAKDLLKEMDEI